MRFVLLVAAAAFLLSGTVGALNEGMKMASDPSVRTFFAQQFNGLSAHAGTATPSVR